MFPSEEQRRQALADSEQLGRLVINACPNSATLLLVAVYLVRAVDSVMGEEVTQSTLLEALRIAREFKG